MKIVVCVKQVPDTAHVRINPETNTLLREGAAAVINPFDRYAVEEAVRLRERLGGAARVTALTMGPPQAEAALREAMAQGADEAILLSDRAFAGADTWATSYTLAQAIRKIGGARVILFGKQATDGDTAQVGPGVATHLDLPQITYARKIRAITADTLTAERALDDGVETVLASLPCVITVVKEINRPRLPTLRDRLRANRAPVTAWAATDIDCDTGKCGLDGSPTKVVRIFTPPARGNVEMLRGTPQEMAEALADRLAHALRRGG